MGRQAKRRRQGKEVMRTSNWSELCPDLLLCVFKRLNFTSLTRAKLVCSSWYSALKDYVPQNQIPWLILFPSEQNNNNRCLLFDPEDRKKVYRTRDLGVEFAQSSCLRICGSWLLLLNDANNLYILNPLTGEKTDLPETKYYFQSEVLEIRWDRACFWIDNKTKDYIVVLVTWNSQNLFIKKGYTSWHNICFERWCKDVFYDDKIQKLFVHYPDYRNNRSVHIWDMSADTPHRDRIVSLPCFDFNLTAFDSFLSKVRSCYPRSLSFGSRIAVTVSRDLLMVSYGVHNWNNTRCFVIYKLNMVNNKWVQVDSLGDEALIYDMGITVVANGSIPGIKRNSIYFGSRDSEYITNGFVKRNSIYFGSTDSEYPTKGFVYDLTTQKVESLPQCVSSCISFYSEACWFFPY